MTINGFSCLGFRKGAGDWRKGEGPGRLDGETQEERRVKGFTGVRGPKGI